MKNIDKTIRLFELEAKIELIYDIILDALGCGNLVIYEKYSKLRDELVTEFKELKKEAK